MILNLYTHEGLIELPNILLDENKRYELGILSVGGVLNHSMSAPKIIGIYYDGIKAMSGPNPYLIMSYLIGRQAFNFAPGNITYYQLRTNQLNATRLKFEVLNAAIEFSDIYIQISIREENDENK